jgi:hypothetical protein
MLGRQRIAILAVPGVVYLAMQTSAAAPPTPAPRPAVERGTSPADRKEFDARAAQLEIGQRIPAILKVLAAPPGRAVATYGLAHREFLDGLLKGLGPDGRAVSIHRSQATYQAELQGGSRWAGRVESIFASDGDAHLEPGSVAVVVAREVDGFYTRQQDLWRQAWQALQPDGRLILIRYPPKVPRADSSSPKTAAPKAPPPAYAGRLAANRPIVEMEQAGFRWMESPKVLTHWVVEVYQRIEATPTAAVEAPSGSGTP